MTTNAQELAKVSVTGEVLEHTKGPKIRIPTSSRTRPATTSGRVIVSS